MNRTQILATLVLAGYSLAGCKSGNYVTVDVQHIPCGTSALDITVGLDGANPDSTSFTNAAELGDGESSFALDLAGHTTGMLTVTVVAEGSGQQLATGTASGALPTGSLVVDLMGQACMPPMVDAGATDDGLRSIDAAIDAGVNCWAPGPTPTNFDPCAVTFPQAGGPLTLSGPHSIDTLNLTLDGVSAGSSYSYLGAKPVMLIHRSQITIDSTAVITVTGGVPLLIVAEGAISIAGRIEFSGASASAAADCDAAAGSFGQFAGPGGGGGGYGGMGGTGGAGAGTASTVGLGGTAKGNAMNSPLRLGCPGAEGGASQSGGLGGMYGYGGGAIEISTKSTIVLSAPGGVIVANGGGGGGGTPGSGATFGGGGGGGAGGSILLEADSLTVGGTVCAIGGGGGEGCNGPVGNPGQQSVGCGRAGGGTGKGGAAGGNGAATSEAVDGTPTTTGGGGGGGGSVGRIRFHAATLINMVPTVVPAPTP